MQTENPDEFYDVGMRNKKFGRVDAMNGPRILEKYVNSFPCHFTLPIFASMRKKGKISRIQADPIYRLTYTVMASPSRTDRLGNFSSRFGMR